MPLDLLQPLGLDIDEDEIVYGRHYRLALAPSRSGQLDALHGYEALDVDVVEEALDLQFSGVCHTQSIPVFGSVVHCNLLSSDKCSKSFGTLQLHGIAVRYVPYCDALHYKVCELFCQKKNYVYICTTETEHALSVGMNS